MDVSRVLATLISCVYGLETISDNKTYIMGNWILDEIRPIIRIRKPRGFSIIIPDPTPIKRARFCYKIGASFSKGEKPSYAGELEMDNGILVYTEPLFKEHTTVAYYFEIELKNGSNYIARHYTNVFEVYKIRPHWGPEKHDQIHFGPNRTSQADWKAFDPLIFYMDRPV